MQTEKQDFREALKQAVGDRSSEGAENFARETPERPEFYTARTKRAVNSLTVERGPKVVPHE